MKRTSEGFVRVSADSPAKPPSAKTEMGPGGSVCRVSFTSRSALIAVSPGASNQAMRRAGIFPCMNGTRLELCAWRLMGWGRV